MSIFDNYSVVISIFAPLPYTSRSESELMRVRYSVLVAQHQAEKQGFLSRFIRFSCHHTCLLYEHTTSSNFWIHDSSSRNRRLRMEILQLVNFRLAETRNGSKTQTRAMRFECRWILSGMLFIINRSSHLTAKTEDMVGYVERVLPFRVLYSSHLPLLSKVLVLWKSLDAFPISPQLQACAHSDFDTNHGKTRLRPASKLTSREFI